MQAHPPDYYPCTFLKACHVLWCVRVKGLKQTTAAILVGLNSGTVSKVVRGLRFPEAFPIPPPDE